MSVAIWRYALALGMLFLFFIAFGDAFDRARFGSPGIIFRSLSDREAIVTAVSAGSQAARAGVRPGDRIAADWLRKREAQARPGGSSNRAGEHLSFYDATLHRIVNVTTTTIPSIYSPFRVFAHVVRFAYFLVALLLFWMFPADRAARALGAFLALAQLSAFSNTGSFVFGTEFSLFAISLSFALVLPMLVLFACWFPQRNPRDGRRLIANLAGTSAGAIFVVHVFTAIYAVTGRGPHLPTPAYHILITYVEPCLFGAMLVAALVIDFRTASALDKRRLEWLTFGMAFEAYSQLSLVFIPAFFTYGGGLNTTGIALNNFTNVIGTFCLLYGFLRYRVLDITFAINRAAVFAILSSTIVALFILIEYLVGKYVEVQSHVTSIVITLGTALAIGLSLRAVHRHVDRFTDKMIFRARHRGNELLREFGRSAAFITDETVLRERTVQALIECADAQYAALYEQSDSGDYAPALWRIIEAPAIVSRHDPIILAMKDRRSPVFVDNRASSVSGELVFPMFVRGELTGFVSCGKRRVRETYAPDEVDAMAYAVEHAAVQLDALRMERLQAQLREVQELVRAYMHLEADGSRVLERIAKASGVENVPRTLTGVEPR